MDMGLESFLAKNNLKILEWVNGSEVLVENKYGICKVRYCNLVNGVIPTIQSSIDKNKYFENVSKEIHGEGIGYSNLEYKNSTSKINLICKTHGEFSLLATSHITKKQGCPKCSKEKPSKRLIGVENFKKKCKKKHNNFYDYSLVTEYTSQYNNVRIKCPIHGEFIQTAKDHMRGAGCTECAKLKISKSRGENPTGWDYTRWKDASVISKRFDSYKVYILECYDENEGFIKIGRTYQEVSKRFRTKGMMPYNYRILREIVDNAITVCNLEAELKSLCRNYKYIPTKDFNGKCECYTKECLETIISNT